SFIPSLFFPFRFLYHCKVSLPSINLQCDIVYKEVMPPLDWSPAQRKLAWDYTAEIAEASHRVGYLVRTSGTRDGLRKSLNEAGPVKRLLANTKSEWNEKYSKVPSKFKFPKVARMRYSTVTDTQAGTAHQGYHEDSSDTGGGDQLNFHRHRILGSAQPSTPSMGHGPELAQLSHGQQRAVQLPELAQLSHGQQGAVQLPSIASMLRGPGEGNMHSEHVEHQKHLEQLHPDFTPDFHQRGTNDSKKRLTMNLLHGWNPKPDSSGTGHQHISREVTPSEVYVDLYFFFHLHLQFNFPLSYTQFMPRHNWTDAQKKLAWDYTAEIADRSHTAGKLVKARQGERAKLQAA
ncbi:hypothetical protein T439DRAFT_375178, partial [Meredithblackwellia eburnea MCA 4105]